MQQSAFRLFQFLQTFSLMASFSSCSSSSKPRAAWTFDVFLSFRGEDTRNNFIDHLYGALVQKGIHTFKDDHMIRRGKPISTELEKSIEESRVAVVVFSENYANSSWCLQELTKIMESKDQIGLKVLPVFYHVDPSDVRKQKGSFAAAFQEHELNFNGEMNEVQKWREALAAAANLSGYHISAISGGEFSVINKIVQDVLGDMQPHGRESNLIGMESYMAELNPILSIQLSGEVRLIGIYGMGGIGKTTIAHALFRRIKYNYEGSSFVKNVRENSSTEKHICALQEKILADILGTHNKFMIQDPEYGANIIQERLCHTKVLLVLDDIDDVKQFEFLAATNDWFGPGSRIIITTRDEHLLSDANAKYKPALLRADQAIELFSMHAFRKNSPLEGYKELSDRAISYTGRLPLALKVLGSFFRGRKADVWESALDRLSNIPNHAVFKTLKLSFDDLNHFEKKIFLDIACFFKGREVKDVTRVLDSFGFHPVIGISVLLEKSLITISKERIGMHDLIQEMGWQIVRESFTNSRLRNLEEVHESIWKHTVQDVIEAIVVPREYNDERKQGFRSNIFENMKNLRLLDVSDEFTSTEPTFLPHELRWICWKYYPFSSLLVPHMSKLVGLEMEYGKIEQLWIGQKIMPNLKFMHMKDMKCITSFPDVTGAPNIESLVLSGCTNLVEVHESVGFLKRLVYMDMSHCENLKCLPSRIEIEPLDTLNLICCSSLETIPEFSACMVKLSNLDLYCCSKIEELPSSIRYLSKLSYLNLDHCTSLENIPNSICELKCLKRLRLHGCSKLQTWPDEFRSMENLQELKLGSAASFDFPNLKSLHSLKKLDLIYNELGDEDFPKNLDEFSSLEELRVSYNSKLIRLPATISHLSHLKQLELDDCHQLQSLHSLPSGIQVLSATNCTSLRKIEDLSNEYECLYRIWLFGCEKLLEDEENQNYLHKMLKHSFLKKWAAVDRCLSIAIPGSKIPNWFTEQEDGHQIALRLPPKWQTQIMGFAICGVFKGFTQFFPISIVFRFGNGSMFVPEHQQANVVMMLDDGSVLNLEANAYTSSSAEDDDFGNVWINYIPFTSLEQMHDEYNDFQREDWSHITQGDLLIYFFTYGQKAIRCGVHVVYKEDLESIPQTKQSVSSYYWNWKLFQWSPNTIWCNYS